MKKARRIARPEHARTDQQLIAHAAADGLATVYANARVTIGLEQVTIQIPGRGRFHVMVYRASE